jgi:hypothetical protein
MWTGCISPGWGAFSNFCKCGYETLNSTNGGEILDNVSGKSYVCVEDNYQLGT